MSQACLVDGRIELCAAGALQPDGAIRASYSLANLPLALGNALATADLPIKLEGTLQGHGEIRRTPQGELFGDVLIESDSGSIFRQLAAVPGDETQEPPQKLLGYRGFKIAATLSGPDARATFDTQLEPNATLHGEASVHDLGRAASPDRGPRARTDSRSRAARGVRAAAGQRARQSRRRHHRGRHGAGDPSCPA